MANTTTIEVRQTLPPAKANPHNVKNPVISLVAAGSFLQEIPLIVPIREFLFQIRKDGQVYWVGAAVPDGISDFSKVQVFFHPTVKNGKAAELGFADQGGRQAMSRRRLSTSAESFGASR